MGLLAEAGAVAFTDGTSAIADALVMRRALSYASTFDLLIVQHPEEPSLAAGGAMTEGEIATRLGLPGINPAAEAIMVERDLRLVEITGGALSRRACLDRAARSRRSAAPRRAACTSPAIPRRIISRSTKPRWAITAPSPRCRRRCAARTTARRWSRASRDGTIDAIASDHAPQDQESKRLPFTSAEPGIVGLETLLPLALELYHNGTLAAAPGAARADPAPGGNPAPARRQARGRRAGRSRAVRSRPALADRCRASSTRNARTRPMTAARCKAGRSRTVVAGRSVFIAAA